MPCTIVNKKVKVLLKETKMSFQLLIDAGGTPNMDFADYASRFSLGNFRSALQNPDISRASLAAMLRRGKRQCTTSSTEESCWMEFLSTYTGTYVNSNTGDV